MNEGHASAGDESPEPEDALGDSRLGHDLGQLISEIRRDEEDFQQSGDTADGDPEPDPFDPSQFSLDTTVNAPAGRPEDAPEADNQEEEGIFESASETETADSASAEVDDLDSASAEGAAGTDRESDEAASAIAQLVSEIETALQRFTQAERDRADQLIAEREAQVAEQ
ncbi:MAG TPA: hypothetical protein VLS27_11065, partial [Gammaproteobacteria bacterium]|nr:hypothetical protein [Gammaproteobacteria bacterium]